MANETEFVLPSPEELEVAKEKIRNTLPVNGLSLEQVSRHLNDDITPGLNRSTLSANFYGYVIGGATPASRLAEQIVAEYDQNLVLHFPDETIATFVEHDALQMACELFGLDAEAWNHQITTTGTTAGNIIGLACGRQFVLQRACARKGIDLNPTMAGVVRTMRACDVDSIQILTVQPHSTLRKAASILGFGHDDVEDVSRNPLAMPRFDLKALEASLKRQNALSIVSVSCGEANSGQFGTDGEDMRAIRQLCDVHGAWLHVDAAFGLLARVLPDDNEFATIKSGVSGMELADSIATDGHKALNIGHDCGIFLSKHLDTAVEVFNNLKASYLVINNKESNKSKHIPSPCNIGLENSRRFRGLPLYASLLSLGLSGHQDMMMRMVRLARQIATFIIASPDYELLPRFDEQESEASRLSRVFIVVLFRAKDPTVNQSLVRRVNRRRRIYISGSQSDGEQAARFAVCNWQVDIDRDMSLIRRELTAILHEVD